MIWILYVIAVLIGLVAIMALVGSRLPATHLAARAARFAHPPDDVWRALRDRDGQTSWRSDLKKLEPLPAESGGERFRETSQHGVITFAVDEVTPPAAGRPGRMITRIADDQLPFGGRWIYVVAADGTGTRLTITEDGIVRNPVFRFLSRYVFGHTKTLETFLHDLGKHLGEAVTPEAATPATAVA